MSQGFPTESSATGQPAQKSGSGRGIMIALIVIGLIVGAGACCCCGGFALFQFGMGVNADQVKDRYQDDPVVVDMLGGIDTCSFNFGESMKESQKEQGTYVFDVDGPKGSGQLIIFTPDNNMTNPERAWLRQGGADFPIGMDEASALPLGF